MTTDLTPESARALLYRHGLPEDVIDGVLCLHAQELAAVQRREAAVWGVDTAAGKHILAAADLIDPTRTAPAGLGVSATPSHTDQATVLLSEAERLMLRHALDLADANISARPDEYTAADEAALASLRRLADEAQQTGATPETDVDLTDGPVRCPLCPTPVTLHTPNGARAHFTTVHPEQRITGRGCGPWPLIVTDEDEAQRREPGRSDVGTEFVRQADAPDEAGLAAFETDLTEAPQPEPPVHGESVAHLAGLHDDEPAVDARQDEAQDRG